MPSAKEIRDKIKTIKSTQQITRAMEMVAASKMRKAQDRMHASRPYANRLREVIAHLVRGTLEYDHPYMQDREIKKVGFIVVSTDRGLCGSLNSALFRKTLKQLENFQDDGKEISLCTLGAKGTQFFKRIGGEIKAAISNLGDRVTAEDVIGPVKVMLDAYSAGEIDKIFLCYNEFLGTMSQDPQIEQLLPVIANVSPKKVGEVAIGVAGTPEESVAIDSYKQEFWDYIYEPKAEELLDGLLLRYIESLVYQAMVENIACEQAARMIAMKSATENAGDLISEFQLLYNKARQAAITKELSEIVSGAQAV